MAGAGEAVPSGLVPACPCLITCLVPAGTLVLLSLAYLTSSFYYIPKAALAAVIIGAVAPMFDAGIFRTLWRVKSRGTSHQRHALAWVWPTALPASARCPTLGLGRWGRALLWSRAFVGLTAHVFVHMQLDASIFS